MGLGVPSVPVGPQTIVPWAGLEETRSREKACGREITQEREQWGRWMRQTTLPTSEGTSHAVATHPTGTAI